MNKETYEYHGEIYEITNAIYHGDTECDLTNGKTYEGFLMGGNIFVVIADDAGDAHEIYSFTIVNTIVNKNYILIGA